MWTRVGSVVLVTAMTRLDPALGTSEATHRGGDDSGPDAVLYELTEHAVITDEGLRIATSSLEGSARRGSALCPRGLQAYAKAVYKAAGIHVRIDPRCAVVAIGQSQIGLTTVPPSGEISGNFWIVVNSDATNLTDAQELVIMNGTFKGTIQVADKNDRGRPVPVRPDERALGDPTVRLELAFE